MSPEFLALWRGAVLTAASGLVVAVADIVTGAGVPSVLLAAFAVAIGIAATVAADPRPVLLVSAVAVVAMLAVVRLLARRG